MPALYPREIAPRPVALPSTLSRVLPESAGGRGKEEGAGGEREKEREKEKERKEVGTGDGRYVSARCKFYEPIKSNELYAAS